MPDRSDGATPFELLGHEIRIATVEALVERRKEDPQDPALSFADLRDRAGIRDSGQFNYHLDKLRGRFVHETEEGYRLTHAGREVAGAILAGTFGTAKDLGAEALGEPCRACDSEVVATYEDGILSVECERGHLNHSDYFPPELAERVSLPTAVELSALYGHHKLELMLREVCPSCTGAVTTRIESSDEAPTFLATCRRCGYHFAGPPGLVVLTHPALRAFYLERGRDVRTAFLWSIPFLVEADRTDVESESPLRVRIDASLDGEELQFRVGADCSVLEYGQLG